MAAAELAGMVILSARAVGVRRRMRKGRAKVTVGGRINVGKEPASRVNRGRRDDHSIYVFTRRKYEYCVKT